MLMLKNRTDPELIEANFHARLSHSKQLLKNINPMFTNEKTFTATTPKNSQMTDCTNVHQPRRKTL